MTIRLSLLTLAMLLLISVLASLSAPANAYGIEPTDEDGLTARRILSTGPLNIVVFEVSRR